MQKIILYLFLVVLIASNGNDAWFGPNNDMYDPNMYDSNMNDQNMNNNDQPMHNNNDQNMHNNDQNMHDPNMYDPNMNDPNKQTTSESAYGANNGMYDSNYYDNYNWQKEQNELDSWFSGDFHSNEGYEPELSDEEKYSDEPTGLWAKCQLEHDDFDYAVLTRSFNEHQLDAVQYGCTGFDVVTQKAVSCCGCFHQIPCKQEELSAEACPNPVNGRCCANAALNPFLYFELPWIPKMVLPRKIGLFPSKFNGRCNAYQSRTFTGILIIIIGISVPVMLLTKIFPVALLSVFRMCCRNRMYRPDSTDEISGIQKKIVQTLFILAMILPLWDYFSDISVMFDYVSSGHWGWTIYSFIFLYIGSRHRLLLDYTTFEAKTGDNFLSLVLTLIPGTALYYPHLAAITQSKEKFFNKIYINTAWKFELFMIFFLVTCNYN